MAENAVPVEFWYDFASSYSYPAAMRIEWLAKAAGVGLVLREPRSFPQNGLKAARLVLLGVAEGWAADFTRVYQANFAGQQDISSEAVLAGLLEGLGLDAAGLIARSNTRENKARLKAQSDEAIARGFFGAPSFTVGEELFWSNDRLEQAVAWAKKS